MKFQHIQQHHGQFGITLMCHALDVSVSGYHQALRRPPSPATRRRQQLLDAIRQSHVESHCRYGSPNIHHDLIDQDIRCCVNTVAKLMKQHGIASIVRRKFKVTTTDSDHDQPVFENSLDRSFIADTMNQKWACDITYVPTDEGFLYLAGVVDLFSRKIVGWSMKDYLGTDLCVEALEMALAARRPGHGLLHHSDRGCQYASQRYQQQLDAFGIRCSMSRVGDCWDNAVVESLWASLKCELIYQREFNTKQEAKEAIFQWIVVWYNRKRRHSSLGYISPEMFEAAAN